MPIVSDPNQPIEVAPVPTAADLRAARLERTRAALDEQLLAGARGADHAEVRGCVQLSDGTGEGQRGAGVGHQHQQLHVGGVVRDALQRRHGVPAARSIAISARCGALPTPAPAMLMVSGCARAASTISTRSVPWTPSPR